MGLPQSYAAGNITALSSSFLVAGLSSRTKLPAWVAASVDKISLVNTEYVPGASLLNHCGSSSHTSDFFYVIAL